MPMNEKKMLVLSRKQIQQKINRIAYQILEDNLEEQEIVLAGIVPRGYTLARRLKTVLETIASFKISLVEIRLDKDSSSLKASSNIPVEQCSNKVIIVVDDVLNSGRTLAYGLGVFLNIPVKKIRTVILVDRSHKIFPIATDYSGLSLSTVLKEHVSVVIDEQGAEDAVYLS